MTNLVPETAIDYEEIFARGGRNLGDEDFALFKCPSCGQIYLLEYEVDTAFLDADDLSRRAMLSKDRLIASRAETGSRTTSRGSGQKRTRSLA